METTYAYKLGASIRKGLGLRNKPRKLPREVSPQYFSRYWFWRALVANILVALFFVAMFALPFYFFGLADGIWMFFFGFAMAGELGGFIILSSFIRLFDSQAMPQTPAFPWIISIEVDQIQIMTKPNRTTFSIEQVVRCNWIVDDNWDQVQGIEGSFLWLELNNGAAFKIPESSQNFTSLRNVLKKRVPYEQTLV